MDERSTEQEEDERQEEGPHLPSIIEIGRKMKERWLKERR